MEQRGRRNRGIHIRNPRIKPFSREAHFCVKRNLRLFKNSFVLRYCHNFREGVFALEARREVCPPETNEGVFGSFMRNKLLAFNLLTVLD
jgi:hypothetical protein